jgi:regulatory protein
LLKQPRSLKSRALQLLAQRDQSRLELRRKLLRHARSAAAAVDGEGDRDGEEAGAVEQVETLLGWLEASGFLSNERFVESRVHARESRLGNLRIRNELAQHALVLPAQLERTLAESELERALAVRARRFAGAPEDAAEHAAQARFLLGRGFSPELVHRLMRRLPRPEDEGARAAGEAA